MDGIADALIYAVAYINCREDEEEEHLDDDVGALESIAAFVAKATEAEKDALAAAAKRALEAEQSYTPRDSFVEIYSSWMEGMFGEEEWIGNERV